jgi:hypothetical protein
VRTTRGRYRVYFTKAPRFADGAKPFALVSSGLPPASCRVAALGGVQERADELGVEVACRDRAGALADQEFNLLVVAGPPRAGHAVVKRLPTAAGNPLVIAPEHSAGVGPITLTRTGLGTFVVGFSSLATTWADAGTVAVTAFGDTRASCAADGWHVGRATSGPTLGGSNLARSLSVSVQCRTPDGRLSDSQFQVLATTR